MMIIYEITWTVKKVNFSEIITKKAAPLSHDEFLNIFSISMGVKILFNK